MIAAAGAAGKIGIKVSPGMKFNGLDDQDCIPAYEALAHAISPLGLAYLHVMRTGIGAEAALRKAYTGKLLVGGGFLREEAEKTLVEAAIPAEKPKGVLKVEAKPAIPDTKYTEAIARKIAGMPDTYSLQSKTNLDLGRGAVQTSGLSMLLRSEFTSRKRESVSVSIQWYEEFQRYKITGILEN
jgi:hypothetical protein